VDWREEVYSIERSQCMQRINGSPDVRSPAEDQRIKEDAAKWCRRKGDKE